MNIKIILPENINLNKHEIKTKISEMSIKDRLMLRPIFPNGNKFNLTDDPKIADIILIPSTGGTTQGNYQMSKQLPYFEQLQHKFVYYINDDNPEYVYDNTNSIKFVAQPSRNATENKKHNVITIPLVMSDSYFLDEDFIKECRKSEKKYDFCFIGDCTVFNRDILGKAKFPNYLFRNTRGFHLYSIKNDEEKKIKNKKFLTEIASSKFVFCPRGVGSSSFRLYESMMVGSIPIVTGMNDYPFQDKVNWDDFSIRTTLDKEGLTQAYERSTKIDYEIYRENAINFWEQYGELESLFTYLVKERYDRNY